MAALSAATGRPTVQTTSGPVRGANDRGVNVFKSVRYGADTGGSNRFLAPQPAEPWSQVLDCVQAPPIALQRAFYQPVYSEVLCGAYDARMEDVASYVVGSEDCLFLNIWTPSLAVDAKMPVILWVHPGALRNWSGLSPWTDGSNLARQENVVVVSFNHRLGPFGFLYLGDLGQVHEEAANPGLLDMIAALRWLRDNISAFGGDPDNVTLMGESGGAGKVCALLASKPAVGLFHKAIIMGGTTTRAQSRARAARLTAELLRSLGAPAQPIEHLHRLPAADLLRAIGDANPSFVVSGPALTRHPFDPDSPAESAEVPILIGTTTDDMTYLTLGDDFSDELDERSARSRLISAGWGLNGDKGELADMALAAARRLEPGANWRRLFVLAATAIYRDDHLMVVEHKLARNAAPVFMYLFDWKCPAFGGHYGAMHVLDVPFAFSNLDAAPQIFGPQPDMRRNLLATNMSRAWAEFARHGKPGHGGLPSWPAYTLPERKTMILNYASRVERDPMKEVRIEFEALRAARLGGRRAVNG